MAITVNQQYGNQCMVGATILLLFQINDLSLKAMLKGGKAASESGIIAAC
jgi:hypothetical protein